MLLVLNTGGQTVTAELDQVPESNFFPRLHFSYYKVTDPGQWITVDKNTGELRVANTIDRESKFVYDGLYNVTVKAVDTSKCLLNTVHLFFFTNSEVPQK